PARARRGRGPALRRGGDRPGRAPAPLGRAGRGARRRNDCPRDGPPVARRPRLDLRRIAMGAKPKGGQRPKAGGARTGSGAAARPAARRPGRNGSGDRLRIRMYNVLFGDAILVTITEGGESRHILIDVGNVTGKGGDVDVFEPVVRDVLGELGDRPLDLYVMTHEHMDHVKGLLYANDKLGLDLKKRLKVRQA